MICEKCGAEMTLQKQIQLNFTSPRFAELGHFKVRDELRNADIYVCPGCGEVRYAPEMPDEPEEKE